MSRRPPRWLFRPGRQGAGCLCAKARKGRSPGGPGGGSPPAEEGPRPGPEAYQHVTSVAQAEGASRGGMLPDQAEGGRHAPQAPADDSREEAGNSVTTGVDISAPTVHKFVQR